MKSTKILIGLFTLLFFSCPPDDLEEEDMTPKAVTYKLLSFVFTQQTDNNEDALSYEIEYFNPNNFEIKGYPKITLTIGGGATTTFTPNEQCGTIAANSSCVLSYNVIDDNPLLFPIEPIEFVSADYILE
ncbi:hypothetical protein [Algibacter sp. 2305UL17-15]|uniref:hypothetical protein n=1 Tax=Algibacter sp. 2305UL17-15 TaxID=3231268 RepID=UPI0034597FAD